MTAPDTKLVELRQTAGTELPSTPIQHELAAEIPQEQPSSTALPLSLAATKRKFHDLLDNFAKPARQRNLDLADAPQKRIRLEPRSRADQFFASRPITPSTINSRLRTSSRIVRATESEQKAPIDDTQLSYTPWSQKTFLNRLQSFSEVRRWTPKPEPINEVAWAKRGWTCVGINAVACKACEGRVVVALRPPRKDENGKEIEHSEDFSVEVEDELVKKYVEQISDGHEPDCPWRRRGCGEDILHCQIARQVIWQPELAKRYSTFVAIADKLPPLERLESDLDSPYIATILPPDFLEDVSNTINPVALAFALAGWHGPEASQDGAYAMAHCEQCFRRLGLWLYQNPATVNPAADSVAAPKLDLRSNHREYCPWVNGESQCMHEGALAGMSLHDSLRKVVENCASFHKYGPYGQKSQLLGIAVTNDSKDKHEDDDSRPGTAFGGEEEKEKTLEECEEQDRKLFARVRAFKKSIRFRSSKSKLLV